jgi:hypothetical protein
MYDLVREGTGIRDAQKKITELINNLKWMENKEKKLAKVQYSICRVGLLN